MVKKDVSVLILAAGESKRMKTQKAFLAFDKNRTFFDKILETYISWGCIQMVAVINKQFKEYANWEKKHIPQLTFVTNDHLEYERFYSVKIGLNAMKETDFCFLQNIDNPFINSQLLDQLYLHRSEDTHVVPVYGDQGGHPVLLNNKSIIHLKAHPENRANLKNVLGELNSKRLLVNDKSVLININNPEDYRKLVEVK